MEAIEEDVYEEINSIKGKHDQNHKDQNKRLQHCITEKYTQNQR